jgi:3-oxoacyl-(acyl-carrier-protein) synthase
VTALAVLAEARWPESADDVAAPSLPGFVVSSFSALAAEVAGRCLSQRDMAAADRPVTAVVMASSLGDVASAIHVAEAVDSGGRVGPLLFFQSVPNSVAGHVAARWQLTGPVVSVGGMEAGLDVAALLIEDADADEALLIRVEQACDGGADTGDRAEAVLVAVAQEER